MHNHLVSTHKRTSSVVYSVPRDMVTLEGLTSALDNPMTKRARTGNDEALMPGAPDIDMPQQASDASNARVCFKIVFLNPHSKKTLNVPVGAGGTVRHHGVAITIHKETFGADVEGCLVVNQCASESSDLHGHWILGGFTSAPRERVEREVSRSDRVHICFRAWPE
jgi:hypothetical protein